MMTGECIYCGQIRQVNVPEGTPKEEVNRAATLNCECEESIKVYKLEEMKSAAEKNIDFLFREEYPEIANLIKAALPAISKRKLEKVTIKDKSITGTIMITGKGHIKVERSEIQRETRENK